MGDETTTRILEVASAEPTEELHARGLTGGLHRRRCRAVLVTTAALRPTVDTLAQRLRMPDLPMVEVPLANREQDTGEIAETARAAVPAIVRALTG